MTSGGKPTGSRGTPPQSPNLRRFPATSACASECPATSLLARDQLNRAASSHATAHASLLRKLPIPSTGPCPDPVRDTSSTADAEPSLASRRTFRSVNPIARAHDHVLASVATTPELRRGPGCAIEAAAVRPPPAPFIQKAPPVEEGTGARGERLRNRARPTP